jgi:hypothetical protein
MPLKRYSTFPEKLLSEVISGLEEGGAKAAEAVGDLFEWGPLLSKWRAGQAPWSPEHRGHVARELLDFVRAIVHYGSAEAFLVDLRTSGPMTFGGSVNEGKVTIDVEGEHLRDVAVLQFIILLKQVGLRNVRACGAPDCERVYVKVNRRLFCSPQCQKRVYAREMRGRQRELRERRRRARHRRQGGE